MPRRQRAGGEHERRQHRAHPSNPRRRHLADRTADRIHRPERELPQQSAAFEVFVDIDQDVAARLDRAHDLAHGAVRIDGVMHDAVRVGVVERIRAKWHRQDVALHEARARHRGDARRRGANAAGAQLDADGAAPGRQPDRGEVDAFAGAGIEDEA